MSVEDLSEVHTVHFPEKLSRRWLPRATSEWFALIILWLCYMNVSKFYGNVRLFAALAIVVLITPLTYGRVYATVGIVYDWYIKFVLKDVLYKANDHSLRARLRLPPPIPGIIDAIEEVGLQHNKDADTDTVYIFGDGSALLSKSFEEQSHFYRQVEAMIRLLAASHKLNIGIGWQFKNRPLDQRKLDQRLYANLHPDVAAPVALDPERPFGPLTRDEATNLALHNVQQERFVQQMENEAHVLEAMVLTIKRSPKLKAAAKSQELSYQEEARLPVLKLTRMAVQTLARLGVRNPRVASAADLKRNIRTSHDVFTLDEYFDLSPEAQLAPRWYSPQSGIVVKHDACRVDETWHATVMITGGASSMPFWQLRMLFGANVEWLSVAAPSETVSYRDEYLLINWFLTPGSIAIRGGLGQVRSGEAGLARERAREERQRRLYYSRWAQHITIVASVAADSYDEVIDQVDKLSSHIRYWGFDCVQIKGRRRQIPAMWTATTCCNLL